MAPSRTLNIISGLQKQYILVLALIGFLAVLGAVLLEVVILSQDKGAEIINVAGRQRMLSQRISLYADRLQNAETPQQRLNARNKLEDASSQFKTSHDFLRSRKTLSSSPAELALLYNALPYDIDRHISQLFQGVDGLIEASRSGLEISAEEVSRIVASSETLLPKLDRVVNIHQKDLETKTQKLRTYQWANLVAILSVLFLSSIYVFQRILNNLATQINALSEADERFRSITNSTEISVLVASGESGLIEAWNPAAERTFGYSAEEIIGQSISRLMPERHRLKHNDGFRKAYHSETYHLVGKTIEIEALHKDGHEFPIELSLGTWKSHDRKYFSAIIHDISERKKSEQEKEALRQQLITAIEAMTEGFALFDAQDRLVICNSVFRDFYQNHVESLQIGNTLENILRSGVKKGSFPAAIGCEEEWIAKRMQHHRNPGEPVEQQLVDGRWLLINEQRTRDGGVVGVRTDITQRRKSEAELRKLKMAIEQSRNTIMITDKNGIIEYANPHFTHISGYDNDEVIGQNPSILASGLEPAPKFKELWETITNGHVWQGRIQNKRKNGEIYIEEVVISPIRDDHGNITHFLAIQDDITEQLRLEDNLKRRQKLEAVGQLAGGLAHDFNNLLAIIGGNLELVQRFIGDNEKASRKVETALKAANRGAKLTKQLLGFTRQSATSIQTLYVNDIIRDISPLLEHSLSKSIELKFQLDDNLYPVDIDAGDFEDCLVNLAVNAKHAISHDGELLIETQNVERNFDPENHPSQTSPYVQISVSDNGCGIPEDIREKIFEPFFSTKEKGQGTGLGLAMVFGFVRRSNGFIRVYSEVNIGTSFKIFLPASEKAELSDRNLHKQSEEVPGGNEHILLVDDEEELLEIAQAHLEEAGYRVTVTTSPKHAISLLENEHNDFDLLLSDVVMPGGINGFDLAFSTLQISPQTRIQLTSGFTAQAGQDLIEGNIFAKQLYRNLLAKPYSRDQLLKAVRSALDAENILEWTNELNVGVENIDRDHKMLVALLNRLYQACRRQETEETFHSILRKLAEYTAYHFDREEEYMEEIGYPHLKNHRQVHQLLKTYINAEIEKFQQDFSPQTGDKLLRFLKNWLFDHVMGMDHDIAAFLNKKSEDAGKNN